MMDSVGAGNDDVGLEDRVDEIASNGQTVRSPNAPAADEFPMWAIGVIVAVALLLIVAVVVIVVLVKRRHSRSATTSSSMAYAPLHSSGGDFVPMKDSAPKPAPVAGMQTCRLAADVFASEPTILACKAGDRVTIEKADWEGTTDWVWASRGASSGYVPRNLCQPW